MEVVIIRADDNGLERKLVRLNTMIIFRDKWIEFIEEGQTTPITVPFHLIKLIK